MLIFVKFAVGYLNVKKEALCIIIACMNELTLMEMRLFLPRFLALTSLGALPRLQVELMLVACWMVQEEEEEE